jgi:hypothetical protein
MCLRKKRVASGEPLSANLKTPHLNPTCRAARFVYRIKYGARRVGYALSIK